MGVAGLPASPQESKLFEQGFPFSVVASRKNSYRPEILAKLAYKLAGEPLSRVVENSRTVVPASERDAE